MRRCLVALFFLSVGWAEAAEPSVYCFTGFSSLVPGSEKAQRLVAETYGGLLDLPADPAARRRLAERLAEGEDPFLVPSGDAELIQVKKRLREFGEMLRSVGRDTPDTRKALRAVARERIGLQAKAEEQAAKSLKDTISDRRFTMPVAQLATQSPDGRYFVSQNPADAGTSGSFHVLDTKTGKTQSIPSKANEFDQRHWFSNDGTKLLVPHGLILRVYAFENGTLSPTPVEVGIPTRWERWFTSRKNEDHTCHLAPLAHPRWVVGQIYRKAGLVLYDLEKKTLAAIPGTKEIVQTIPLHYENRWGVVPGENAIVTFTEKDGKAFLSRGEVSAEGKVKQWQTVAEWDMKNRPPFSGEVELTRDYVVLRHEHWTKGGFTAVSLRDNTPRDFTVITVDPMTLMPTKRLTVSPQTNVLAIDYAETTDQRSRMQLWDLTTGKELGRIAIPFGQLTFTPDGKFLVVKQGEDVRVLNYQHRFE